ncbi:S-adenosyl-L-methionine-dependent methyltransferase [Eremomyces bilateralis CBS 781.70]|uniref:S-adenosyl-L-methionine-dependent methyltransferase n=1 Tax=Eremomyces bilateralis CBS 781.70 TaxID=1392243 RepID=A0A6G1G970_9PEZI|nr:S-adenosyl-L-methionine-dependent methyltransferase [Eremomyces bilateralis CBS 781.70]KAF1814563.1 S-adenosyl-L-methionine-dependent methyltransferase [Eremomyces bilateralis CBS 781.70]
MATKDSNQQNASVNEVISNLEVDEAALAQYISSTTTSIKASVTDYRYEHGRRYHAYGDDKYHLPNDEKEIDRLELQHLIWVEAFNGRLYLSPLPEDMTDVLDVGCGTGNWTIEFATAHPSVAVLGTDLSPIQPSNVPVNCHFVVDDATQEWAFGQKFDFVHTRAITMGIGDWDGFIKQAYCSLKPGGWIELQEFSFPIGCDDGTMKDGSPLAEWAAAMVSAIAKVGMDPRAALKHPNRLRTAGFANVQELPVKCPLGQWPKGSREKKLGVLGQKDLLIGIEGISTKLLRMSGYSEEKVNGLLEACRRDLLNPMIHVYFPLTVSWAQKPLEETG